MTTLTHSILALCATVSIASAIGFGSYALCRAIERKFEKVFSIPTSCILCVYATVLLSVVLFKDGMSISIFLFCSGVCFFILCSFGASFHRKTSGHSSSLRIALEVLLFSIVLSSLIGIYLKHYLPASIFVTANISTGRASWIRVWPEGAYYLMLFLSPAIAPFLLWLHQTSRLRPGLDVPINPETIES